MDISLKRIIAFVIDIVLLTFVLTVFVNLTHIDPYMNNYKKTNEQYLEEIKKENNEDTIISLNYDLYKYKVVSNGLSVIFLIGYFGVFQMLNKGQTLGKKLMKIKVVSNSNKKLTFINYLIRIIVLNNIIFTILNIVLVYLLKDNAFYYVTYICSLLSSLIYLVNIMMIILKRDNRGLHDILAKTKVVKCN